MSVVLNAQKYYRTAEVCRMIGISKNTLFRWLKKFVFSKVERRDSRGWRLFTEEEVEKLRKEVSRVNLVRPTRSQKITFSELRGPECK